MKILFFLINLCIGGLAAWQGLLLYRIYTLPADLSGLNAGGKGAVDITNAGGQHQPPSPGVPSKSRPAEEQVIVGRNLFGVLKENPKKGASTDQVKPALEQTKLRLTLWGTVTGDAEEDNWAVIEDQAKRLQALYRSGDLIQGAKIKSISRHRVILNVNGEDQVLEAKVKTTKNSSPPGKPPMTLSGSGIARPTPMNIAPKVGSREPDDLLRAMKTRPYLKNGTPSGLLVYGIRPDSGIKSLGLRNGDIILTVNDTAILNPGDLEPLADGLGPDPDLHISLMRQGRVQNVVYNGQSRSFTSRADTEN